MISWFTRNGVAANLLMFIILVCGAVSLSNIKLELFPQFDLDMITISVAYPGATPEETEEGICVKIEEQIQDLEGIKEMTSRASEGMGLVTVELLSSADSNELLSNIKARVDAINTFPDDAEKPVVELPAIAGEVMNVTIHGPTDERTLKQLAEKMRNGLLAYETITQVDINTSRPYELSVEVSEEALRRYNLTFDAIVDAIRAHSLDIPGGTVRADSGEVLLRSVGQAYTAEEFSAIPLITKSDGSRISIGDVGQVIDGLETMSLDYIFDGEPAVSLRILEVGTQSSLDIARCVHEYIELFKTRLPSEIKVTTWGDSNFYLKGRINMLIKNGTYGLCLVFILLALFLRPSLAAWVTLGILVSFMGAFALIPFLGVSINIISLFGFIMVLGIVVDDAIVVGESVFSQFQKHGGPGVNASIEGSHAVAIPVVFAVITTAVAFVPILLLPGFQGKFMQHIPYVVIVTLMISLVESKLILPYHLTLCKVGSGHRDKLGRLQKLQRAVADGLERFVETIYKPSLATALRHKYSVLSVFIGLLMVTLGYVSAGHLPFSFFPKPASDYISISLEMFEGIPVSKTRKTIDIIERELQELIEELNAKGHKKPIEHVGIIVGKQPFTGDGSSNGLEAGQSHLAQFIVEMEKSENRSISAPEFAALWRDRLSPLPGVKDLTFIARAAASGNKPISIRLAGNNVEQLRAATLRLKEKLGAFAGVYDPVDDFSGGKRQLNLTLKPEAEVLGLTHAELGRQVRAAFYGAEAQRVQREREDVRVMVRYPQADRESLATLDFMRIRTPNGRAVPFHQVAEATMDYGPSTIKRINRKRTLQIDADLDRQVGNLKQIQEELENVFMPKLMETFPGLSWSFGGEIKDGMESTKALSSSTIVILCVIYILMAIPFKSYIQPLIIMSVIPFGLIGAIWGHVLFGIFYEINLSLLSILGMLAMAGVLVNDSLVMVDYINKQIRAGTPYLQAVHNSGIARFRPILLTSLTTFVGIAPILFESSLQAQFLKPMALSLAFGVLFGTFITLFLVPACYLILEDTKTILRRLFA